MQVVMVRFPLGAAGLQRARCVGLTNPAQVIPPSGLVVQPIAGVFVENEAPSRLQQVRDRFDRTGQVMDVSERLATTASKGSEATNSSSETARKSSPSGASGSMATTS
jgi:hypothetical protein